MSKKKRKKKAVKKKHKKARGSLKGTPFERDSCKNLSLWWTNGNRDDVFWRTSQSGGRATIRNKGGKATKNQYGDVQATDPIGQPLIDLCTIELKKGYSSSTFFDLVDKILKGQKLTYCEFIKQAIEQQKNAGSWSWLLITKSDYKETLVAMPITLKRLLIKAKSKVNSCYPQTTMQFMLNDSPSKIFVTTLNEFMDNVNPLCFRRALKIIRKKNNELCLKSL